MAGKKYVCHAAALVPGTGAADSEFERVNVGGTRTVCEAAVDAGVSRLLHVSTVYVFGIHPGALVDENSTPLVAPHAGYDSSKVDAETVVMAFASKSLDVVVVNPAVVFGPRSRYSGRLINLFLRRLLPAVPLPNRMLSLVYSDDVARGARLALEKGQPGERYILAGPSVTVRDFMNALARASGRSAPRFTFPEWLVTAGVSAAWAVSPVTRWKPPVTVSGIRHGGTLYDGGRAEIELGLDYTPLDESLAATVAWMQGR
jgi:nucleoside-diphosphate-sugar epimerase